MRTKRLTQVAPHPVQRPPRRWRKLIPYVVVGGLIATMVAGFLPKPIRVETGAVTRGPLVVSVYEEGKTRIRHRYVISPPVAGFLRRVELRPGAPIEAGKTVLAIIEPQMSGFLDARSLAQAEAAVKAAQATKMQRQAELERANTALDLANKDLARADSLRRTGAIAAKDWDAEQNRVQMLTRELHAAEFALKVAEFEVTQAEAALMQARHADSNSSEPVRILAPVDGYVLNVYEESARVVIPGTPIMEVGDPQDLEAEIELLSSDAVGVAPGADVSIEHWGGDSPLRGRVSVVEPAAFTKISALGVEEQRVMVRVDFVDAPPPGRELGDRYRVEARIVTWRGDDILQVPTAALFRRGNDWMTFTVRQGRAQIRRVEIGHNNGVAAEVRSSVSAGDLVIVHPPDSVHDGAGVVQGK
jgi:HlyD family secretion protein